MAKIIGLSQWKKKRMWQMWWDTTQNALQKQIFLEIVEIYYT